MKKIVFLLFIAGLFSCETQKKDSFTITGTMKNVPENSLIILRTQERILDSLRLQNNTFTFTGSVESPQYALITVDGTIDQSYFWLVNSEMTFSAESGKFRQASITGSKLQDEKVAFAAKLKVYDDLEEQIDEYARANYEKLTKKDIDSLRTALTNAENGYYNEVLKYAKANPNSLVSLYYLDFYKTSIPNKQDVQESYDALTPEMKAHPMGKELGSFLAKAEIVVGGQYADITLKNTQDEEKSLSQNLGEYTLVAFWEESCVHCRAYNPKLVKIHEQFNAKGFNVFGVSLDRDKDRWLKAVKEDQLPWENVVDTRGKKGDVAKQYSISAIPANVLLDKDGKVLAKNMDAESLEKNLERLLK
jgi:peroxiredoxin